MSVVLFTKKDAWSRRAQAIAKENFEKDLTIHEGDVGDPLPAAPPSGATLLSFLSPWIIPRHWLEQAALALNFHPGNRDFPGTGCYNFALYNEATRYGAVCHSMLPKVDTGAILLETNFEVAADETVENLKLKTMQSMTPLFERICKMLAGGQALPEPSIAWTRRPYLRKELDALCEITQDMDDAEVQRRIRAVTYPGKPGAWKMVDGKKHFFPVPQRAPKA